MIFSVVSRFNSSEALGVCSDEFWVFISWLHV